jgi:DNA-binding SARP family transcriptional activator/anti-sigma regulatory factor (Ser/Thr protein kinase)
MELASPLARSFPATPSGLSEIGQFLRKRAAEAGLSPRTTQELVLAAADACTKAIRHTSSFEMTVAWKDVEGGADVEIVEQGVLAGPGSSRLMKSLGEQGIPLTRRLVGSFCIGEGTSGTPGTVVGVVKTEAASVVVHPDAPTHISLLGGFGLAEGGSDLVVAEGSQRLLAFLALRRRPVKRTLVAGTLWPLSTETHAYSSLRSALARLDGARSSIVVTGSDLGVAEGVTVDLWDSEALAHRLIAPGAGASANGSLRADLAALSADLLPDWYEDWAIVESEGWRQLRLHALEALAGILTVEGSYGGAALAALSAIRADPLRESPRAALIRVHLAEGNPSEAAREFSRYRGLLLEELQIEPTVRLRNLAEGR